MNCHVNYMQQIAIMLYKLFLLFHSIVKLNHCFDKFTSNFRNTMQMMTESRTIFLNNFISCIFGEVNRNFF